LNKLKLIEEYPMNDIRRKFLKSAVGLGGIAAAIGTGLLMPQRAFSAYLEDAFAATEVSAALIAAEGSDQHTPSDEIKLKAPDIAENGAVVPITVSSTLPDIESISIIATKNPSPLAASFKLSSMSEGYVSTRIKMGKTSNVVAVVKSGGKLYSATQEVKVTIGGCGG
jgi:sulfur-oxidizing protein SoxY